MKKDTFIPLILVTLLALLFEPFGFMPSMAVMTLLIMVTGLFVIFAVFAWKEKGEDEREEAHVHRADRMAFLVGMAVLVMSIVIEYFTMHEVSRFLISALLVMVVTKAIAIEYIRRHH